MMNPECRTDRWSARARLAVAGVCLVEVLSSPHPSSGLCIASVALMALWYEGVSCRRLRHVLAAPWLIGGGAILLRWLLGQPTLLIGCRMAGATCVFAWLVCTAKFPRVQAALVALGTPRELVEMMSLALRYARVLDATLRTARDAQRLRMGYATTRRALRAHGVLVGLLVGRAVDQSAMLASALRLRGYNGCIYLPSDSALTAADLGLVALAAIVVGLCEWLPR